VAGPAVRRDDQGGVRGVQQRLDEPVGVAGGAGADPADAKEARRLDAVEQ
jgi:hypothetical protein